MRSKRRWAGPRSIARLRSRQTSRGYARQAPNVPYPQNFGPDELLKVWLAALLPPLGVSVAQSPVASRAPAAIDPAEGTTEDGILTVEDQLIGSKFRTDGRNQLSQQANWPCWYQLFGGVRSTS
jgi:hypothetical protein